LYNKSVELNNLVASCQQAVDNLSTSWEQAVRTHPVDKMLVQHCYKSAAGLLQLVRFYVCTTNVKLVANQVYFTVFWRKLFIGMFFISLLPVSWQNFETFYRFILR
jgi:hypothetical protein